MAASTRALRAALPPTLAAPLDAVTRYLRGERNRSPHTVRAYLGDVAGLLDHAARMGIREPDGLSLAVLRSWLARLRSTGAARATLARRSAAARTFTAWGHREGWLAQDVGAQLASPKPRRTLPTVLRVDQAAVLTDATEAGEDPLDRRDGLILELLYASGLRVSELCGLDLDD